ncbi:hypothetical protein CPC08DRAFT_51852 [Agrocybe pediades]|nr:hypothetical protein CPC08DRAFT_51852 [Agrocybe pediades]
MFIFYSFFALPPPSSFFSSFLPFLYVSFLVYVVRHSPRRGWGLHLASSSPSPFHRSPVTRLWHGTSALSSSSLSSPSSLSSC